MHLINFSYKPSHPILYNRIPNYPSNGKYMKCLLS